MVGQTLSFRIYSTPEWQCVGIKEGIAGRNGQSEYILSGGGKVFGNVSTGIFQWKKIAN